MGQFLPADHSRGDANTVGGYTAVHSRPPAFEGKDGASYSVEVMTDETGDTTQPWAGYLFFVRYQRGDPIASGHVETPYLRFARTEAEARALVESLQLSEALNELNKTIAAESGETRPWYDVMRDEEAG